MGRYIKGGVDESVSLTTLAARTLVSGIFDDSVSERTLITSLVGRWAMTQYTFGTNIGPVMVGLAHSDYTDAEIQEVIDNSRSWEEQDLIGQEVGKRKVKIVGIFQGFDSPTADMVLKDGMPIKTKLNWILNSGQTLRVWAYNLGTVAIGTTVPIVHCEGHANLWPK